MLDEPNLVIIACGVFRGELETLRAQGVIPIPIRYLDSRWHMDPEKLHEKLDSKVQAEIAKGNRVILLYGDCHAHMVDQYAANAAVVRVRGANCCEILLGAETHKCLVKEERAFVLFPEWAERWHEILVRRMGADHMGLDEQATIALMQNAYSRFVFLDTEVQPVPAEKLAACSEFFGMPCDIRKVETKYLVRLLEEAAEELPSEVALG